MGGQRPLCRHRAGTSVSGALERHEKGIARLLDFVASVPVELPSQQCMVARQRGPVGLSGLLPQGGGSLDIGEQEGDGAGWGSVKR
jgi:hypothetical protein